MSRFKMKSKASEQAIKSASQQSGGIKRFKIASGRKTVELIASDQMMIQNAMGNRI